MWIHIALIALGVQGFCCLQVVLDMNEIMLETAGEALEISDSSFTGAVTPSGKSSSHSDNQHHHASRGHRRNSTAHQSRSAKSGTNDKSRVAM